jgi:hypothetical protein
MSNYNVCVVVKVKILSMCVLIIKCHVCAQCIIIILCMASAIVICL